MVGVIIQRFIKDSSIILVFKYGQSIALCDWVLPVVIDGVDHAVTGGSLRQ